MSIVESDNVFLNREAQGQSAFKVILLPSLNGGAIVYDDDTGFLADVPPSCINGEIRGISYVSIPDLIERILRPGCRSLRKILKELCDIKNALERTYYSSRVSIDDVPEEEYFRSVGFSGASEVILEVTDACNMRCRYCVFGGNYVGYRVHGFSYMSNEVIEAGLRLYLDLLEKFKYLNPFREPVIGFYGGEPLLNFRAVEYATEFSKKLFSDRGYEPRFTISTNGTLLEGRAAKFLAENNFAVFVSLDGPKEEHDRNRVMADGSGSFDRVMNNVRTYSRMLRSLGIKEGPYALVTLDIRADLFKLREFFNAVKDEIMLTFINMVRAFDTNYYSRFTEDDFKRFRQMEFELAKEFLDYVRSGRWKRDRDVFLDAYFGRKVLSVLLDTKLFRMVSPLFPASRTCIPPHKIYVTAKGTILPCERCPTGAVIGDVWSGLDYIKIKAMLKKYQEFQERRCLRCGIKHSCGSCIAMLYPFTRTDNSRCVIFARSLTGDLRLAAQVLRINPEYVRFIEKVMSDPLQRVVER